MSNLSEEDAKRLWFANLLNQFNIDTGVDVEEVFDKLTGENMDIDLKECRKEENVAEVSTKRMFMIILKAQEMMLENNPSKKGILQILSSLEHDILMLNDRDTSIMRDLFK